MWSIYFFLFRPAGNEPAWLAAKYASHLHYCALWEYYNSSEIVKYCNSSEIVNHHKKAMYYQLSNYNLDYLYVSGVDVSDWDVSVEILWLRCFLLRYFWSRCLWLRCFRSRCLQFQMSLVEMSPVEMYKVLDSVTLYVLIW